jgi:protein-tyrosine phosphatase
LGSFFAAKNKRLVQELNIQHILVLGTAPLVQHPEINYKVLALSEEESEFLLSHLSECFSFIDGSLAKSEPVLVACNHGVNLGAAVVIAYAMREKGWEFQVAFDYVASKRPIIQPNAGFTSQLEFFGSALFPIFTEGNLKAQYDFFVMINQGSLYPLPLTLSFSFLTDVCLFHCTMEQLDKMDQQHILDRKSKS